MPGASWRTKTFRQAQSGQLGTRAKSVVANHLAPSHTSTLPNTRENTKKFSTTGHQCGKAYCRDAALATEQTRPGMLEFRWHDLGFWRWPFLSESFGWCSIAWESASCPTPRITAMSDGTRWGIVPNRARSQYRICCVSASRISLRSPICSQPPLQSERLAKARRTPREKIRPPDIGKWPEYGSIKRFRFTLTAFRAS